MSESRSQVNFTVDAEAHERAKRRSEYGELSERLRQTINELAYGTEVTERKRLKEKLEDLRGDKRDVDKEIEDLRHQRDELEREISRVEDRLDALMDTEGEYEGFLQAIESDLHEGMRFDPGHGKIERAAELGDCDEQDVIDALRERNPEVPNIAFKTATQGVPPNWKEAMI